MEEKFLLIESHSHRHFASSFMNSIILTNGMQQLNIKVLVLKKKLINFITITKIILNLFKKNFLIFYSTEY